MIRCIPPMICVAPSQSTACNVLPPPHGCRHLSFEFKKFRSAVEKEALFDCYMQIDDAEAQKTGLFLRLTNEVSKQSCGGG